MPVKIIGENIHIISPKVKEAIAARDGAYFQELAVEQVRHGAVALDLNIGPQKKMGHEILPWLVETVQEVIDGLAPVAAELADALRARLQADAKTDDKTGSRQRDAADERNEDPEYRRLWEALGHDPTGIDSLSERTGLTVETLSSMLLLMELDGRVSSHLGRYARAAS